MITVAGLSSWNTEPEAGENSGGWWADCSMGRGEPIRASRHNRRPDQLRLLEAGLAYTLVNHIREGGLRKTSMARAQRDTIRLRLLKVEGGVVRNTRRVRIYLSSAFPDQEPFRLVLTRLRPAQGSNPAAVAQRLSVGLGRSRTTASEITSKPFLRCLERSRSSPDGKTQGKSFSTSARQTYPSIPLSSRPS